MARIEHIRQKLENWALWRSRMNDGGLGYSSRNIMAVWAEDVWSGTSYHGASIPHSEADAEAVDRAVQSLKLSRSSHLYETLDCHYLRGMGVSEVARHMGRARCTINAQLDQADRYIDNWLRAEREQHDKMRAQAEAERAAAQGSFTS
ncbi:MAG: hypothetical protein GXY45_11545 [Ramlibacter sp.]|nr:hypothetical protein [Ramlibacter sp.]